MEEMILGPWETAMAASSNLKRRELDAALLMAICTGNESLVGALLAGGANPNGRGEDRRTRLHRAAGQTSPNSVKIVQALLAAGAKPNAADAEGWTPIHFASSYGSVEMVQALLAAGSDPDKRNAKGLHSEDLANVEAKAYLAARRQALAEESGLLDASAPARAPPRSSAL